MMGTTVTSKLNAQVMNHQKRPLAEHAREATPAHGIAKEDGTGVSGLRLGRARLRVSGLVNRAAGATSSLKAGNPATHGPGRTQRPPSGGADVVEPRNGQ